MPHTPPSSEAPSSVGIAEVRVGKKKLELLKARQQSPRATAKRIAKAVKAVESLGVDYDRLDAETWRVIGQHPDLEGF